MQGLGGGCTPCCAPRPNYSCCHTGTALPHPLTLQPCCRSPRFYLRGSTYLSGPWGSDSAPALNRRSSSGPQPIPGKQRHGFGGDGGPLSLPLDSLLRPVRKVRLGLC